MTMQAKRVTRRDHRYTIAREWCGYATRRYVVRFCGQWIAQTEHKAAAEFIRDQHKASRDAFLQTPTAAGWRA